MPRVELWYARTDWIRDDEEISAYARLLASSEQERRARFVFERHRHEYLVTRALARTVLATYVRRPPETLCFVITDHGRPLLEDGGDLRFNLTNTVALVACAVCLRGEIGADAEPLARGDDVLGVAETVFTDHERQALSRLPPLARRRRAVELWTLKEAYMKARGLGFSLPVERFEMHFTEARPDLRLLPPLLDERRWTFQTLEIEDHLVSICVENPDDESVDVVVRVGLTPHAT
jgi:4'-phosphopantetheinyl transferase